MFELLTFYPFGMFLKLCDSFTNDFDIIFSVTKALWFIYKWFWYNFFGLFCWEIVLKDTL